MSAASRSAPLNLPSRRHSASRASACSSTPAAASVRHLASAAAADALLQSPPPLLRIERARPQPQTPPGTASRAVECEPDPSKPLTLQSKLYWRLRQAPPPKPCDKEVKEALAFFHATQKFVKRKALVVDCCGGHGLVGALYVRFGRAARAVVIDKFRPPAFDHLSAALELPPGVLAYAEADVTTELPRQLAALAKTAGVSPTDVIVVAVHACAHLTDRVADACIHGGVDFAVMPCCHRDATPGSTMRQVASALGIHVHAAVDVARLGAWASRGYDCRFRTIDDSITPENRVLIGLAPRGRATATDAAAAIEAARRKVYDSRWCTGPGAAARGDARHDKSTTEIARRCTGRHQRQWRRPSSCASLACARFCATAGVIPPMQ